MIVQLYASLSANGRVLLAEEKGHEVPAPVLSDFMGHVSRVGNMIIGRKTFDLLIAVPGASDHYRDVDVVVISRQLNKQAAPFHFVSSPRQALQYLQGRGHRQTVVGGGGQIYNAFLVAELVNELYLNINPLITRSGGEILLEYVHHIQLELLGEPVLTGRIPQLHYRVSRY